MEKYPYREPGQRTRDAYRLTEAGAELKSVLVAMQQWGHTHIPQGDGLRVTPLPANGDRVRAALVDEAGQTVPASTVQFTRITPPSVA